VRGTSPTARLPRVESVKGRNRENSLPREGRKRPIFSANPMPARWRDRKGKKERVGIPQHRSSRNSKERRRKNSLLPFLRLCLLPARRESTRKIGEQKNNYLQLPTDLPDSCAPANVEVLR